MIYDIILLLLFTNLDLSIITPLQVFDDIFNILIQFKSMFVF